MANKSTQHDSPRSPKDRTDQEQHGTAGDRARSPADQPAPDLPETERGGSHGAQSTSRINEDEGASGDS